MTEPRETKQDTPLQLEDIAEMLPAKQDWLLTDLIKIANAFSIEFGITLTIGGSAITGTVIGAVEYHRETVAFLEKSNPLRDDSYTSMNIVSDFYKQTQETYRKIEVGKDNIFDEQANYIHLKDAKIYMGGNTIIPSHGGVLWRGRIANVDGFLIGAMQTQKGTTGD